MLFLCIMMRGKRFSLLALERALCFLLCEGMGTKLKTLFYFICTVQPECCISKTGGRWEEGGASFNSILWKHILCLDLTSINLTRQPFKDQLSSTTATDGDDSEMWKRYNADMVKAHFLKDHTMGTPNTNTSIKRAPLSIHFFIALPPVQDFSQTFSMDSFPRSPFGPCVQALRYDEEWRE